MQRDVLDELLHVPLFRDKEPSPPILDLGIVTVMSASVSYVDLPLFSGPARHFPHHAALTVGADEVH